MGWPTTGPVGQSAGGGNIALSADRSLMAAEGAATIESGLRGVFRRPRMASRTGEPRSDGTRWPLLGGGGPAGPEDRKDPSPEDDASQGGRDGDEDRPRDEPAIPDQQGQNSRALSPPIPGDLTPRHGRQSPARSSARDPESGSAPPQGESGARGPPDVSSCRSHSSLWRSSRRCHSR